jgi:MEDS: MEthanogen/methylotroph, DcmR Sensory domain
MPRRLLGRIAASVEVVYQMEITVVGAENLNASQHVVQFYGHDEELAERVAGYLMEALRGQGVAIVIATPEHCRAFETRLTRAGADVARARDDGAYLALDASQTLAEFMAADRLDPAAFDRVVGGVIRQAATAGRPVRAYGEMVALLWDDGLVNAAVQLESMWDELGRRHPFSLLCGYRVDSVAGGADAFAAVCCLHREVLGPAEAPGKEAPGKKAPGAEASRNGAPGAARTFAFSRHAPAAARHFTVGTVRDWGAGDIADDAALVVTELAANAIVHAHSGFTVILSARGDLVRISVRDASPLPGEGSAAEGSAALMPVPLHGLGAVDALASRWGVESLGTAGKTVWVELRRG